MQLSDLRDRLQTLVDEHVSPQPTLSADELITMLEQHILSMRLGCELAYQRPPTGAEGNAHEHESEQSMGASHKSGECFVPAGSWRGKRCSMCSGWMWGSIARNNDWRWPEHAEHATCELEAMADKRNLATNLALKAAGITECESYPYDPCIDEHERSLRSGGRMLKQHERVNRLRADRDRLRAENSRLHLGYSALADALDASDVKLDGWADWIASMVGRDAGYETTAQARAALENEVRILRGAARDRQIDADLLRGDR